MNVIINYSISVNNRKFQYLIQNTGLQYFNNAYDSLQNSIQNTNNNIKNNTLLSNTQNNSRNYPRNQTTNIYNNNNFCSTSIYSFVIMQNNIEIDSKLSQENIPNN